MKENCSSSSFAGDFMIEIKCPRCEQYWYDNDEEGGRVRLCSRCVDHLRLQRGHRAEIDIPFLIAVGVFLVFDLTMIALTALMPAEIGKVTMYIGVVLAIAGGVVWHVLAGGGGWRSGWSELDWRTGRWGLLIFLSGFALIAFCLARVPR